MWEMYWNNKYICFTFKNLIKHFQANHNKLLKRRYQLKYERSVSAITFIGYEQSQRTENVLFPYFIRGFYSSFLFNNFMFHWCYVVNSDHFFLFYKLLLYIWNGNKYLHTLIRVGYKWTTAYKGNNKISELRTILQRGSQNS